MNFQLIVKMALFYHLLNNNYNSLLVLKFKFISKMDFKDKFLIFKFIYIKKYLYHIY